MKQTYAYWWMGRLYIVVLLLAVLLGLAVRGTVADRLPRPPYVGGTTGYDVSWPNCDATPPGDNAWGVVGVTGGLVFRENPCLATEARWWRTTTLYVNTGYAGHERALQYMHAPRQCNADDERCLAYNYGYQAGLYAAERAFAHGLYSRIWWLDVETENSWSDDPLANRESIRGIADAISYKAVGATIGYYSYPGQWDRITDAWRPGGPAWVATGSEERETAVAACSAPSFTGGPVWLTQYVQELDHNYACPDAAGVEP